jgi:hypothetical protein
VRYDGTHRVSSLKSMSNPSQQDFLKAAKDQLGMTWDELATASGINPRALKTYRMPDTSKDFRPLPDLARAAVARLVNTPAKQRKVT